MARLTFPDEGSRLVYGVTGASGVLNSASTTKVKLYSDSAGTVAADIQDTT